MGAQDCTEGWWRAREKIVTAFIANNDDVEKHTIAPLTNQHRWAVGQLALPNLNVARGQVQIPPAANPAPVASRYDAKKRHNDTKAQHGRHQHQHLLFRNEASLRSVVHYCPSQSHACQTYM